MMPNTDISYSGNKVVARPIADDLPPLILSLGYRSEKTRQAVKEFVSLCKAHFSSAVAQNYIMQC